MAVDLFGWRELRAAEAAVEAARADRATAMLKLRCAPHGMRRARWQALTDATVRALRADAELAAVRRELRE